MHAFAFLAAAAAPAQKIGQLAPSTPGIGGGFRPPRRWAGSGRGVRGVRRAACRTPSAKAVAGRAWRRAASPCGRPGPPDRAPGRRARPSRAARASWRCRWRRTPRAGAAGRTAGRALPARDDASACSRRPAVAHPSPPGAARSPSSRCACRRASSRSAVSSWRAGRQTACANAAPGWRPPWRRPRAAPQRRPAACRWCRQCGARRHPARGS